MKFGVREICDVVLKAKAAQKIGNKIFYANEPVIYFDTLKTSSMEGAATTVYAQGGRGNSRLVAWEGERTITFTMEDALISPEGFMILSGAGLIDAAAGKPIYQHITETVDASRVTVEENTITIKVSQKPYLGDMEGENFKPATQNLAYVMFKKDGELVSEPFIPVHENLVEKDGYYNLRVQKHESYDELAKGENTDAHQYDIANREGFWKTADGFDSVLIDYYVARESDAQQIEITADKFGGNYYLEASTLFRDEKGVDMPAEFIIPNCKVQSNFTFTMASSGDPSTFTFTMDAFPGYTYFNKTKKVLCVMQVVDDSEAATKDVESVMKHPGDDESI